MDVKIPDWVQDAIFYQIFPDRFARSPSLTEQNGSINLQPWGSRPTPHGFQGGDLPGIVDKLDYLTDLGVTALYLNPIFASAANHRYHTHDYYQVDPLLGGNEALHQLLRAAHDRNVRVVLDGVFNHASRGFFQFNHLLECGPDSPYVDWFHVKSWPLNAYGNQGQPNYEAWWGLPALPAFNTDTPAVCEFLWDVAVYWLEQGIDGWRLDVPDEIDDDEFWQEFRERCKAVNPDAYIVGELWEDASRWLGGDQFDAQMNYPLGRAILGFFGGDNLNRMVLPDEAVGYGRIPTLNGPAFAEVLDQLHNAQYHPAIVKAQLNMLGSHDTPRLLTMLNEDKGAARLAFLCQMTVAGAPNIFYGDEIGLSGGPDPDCRRAFPWDDEAAWDADLRQDVADYITVRQETPALRRGDFRVIHAANTVVIYERRYKGETAVVAFNIANAPSPFTVPEDAPGPLPQVVSTTGQKGAAWQPGQRHVLNGHSGYVWAD